MENEILNTGVSDRFSVALAALALLVAVVATVYGRRAVFPPKRRLTIYRGRSVAGPGGVTRTTLTFACTGRHAIESSRFDRDRPVVVDLGVPIRSLTVEDDRRARENPPVTARSSAILLEPDLINPGEYVTLAVETDGEPERKCRTRHALTDTVVDSVKGRPPNPKIPKIVLAVVAALVLFPIVVNAINDPDDFTRFLYETQSVSLTPEHGPPGTCVVLTGKNFGDEDKVEIESFDLPDGKAAPVNGCPPLGGGVVVGVRTVVTSTYDGSILARFVIPPGSKGTLTFFISGPGATQAAYFWVD